MLDVASPHGVPREFTLVIPSDDVRHECRIIWIQERRLGVRFERSDGRHANADQSGFPMRSSTILMMAFFLSFMPGNGPALSRGSMATERPDAAEHIEGLPADLRRGIAARERACGNTAAAGHYFSVSIEAGGQRFVSLHFEDFVCINRSAICNDDGCLHEIYVESGDRHRLVFSTRAGDVKLTNDGGMAEIVVTQGSSRKLFRWNGRGFAPAGHKGRGN